MPGALSALYLSHQNRRIVSSNVMACVYPITVILLSLAASSINCSDIQNRLRSAVSLSHTIRPFRLASRRTHVCSDCNCLSCLYSSKFRYFHLRQQLLKSILLIAHTIPPLLFMFSPALQLFNVKTSFSPSSYLSYFKRSGTRTGPYETIISIQFFQDSEFPLDRTHF